MTADHGPLCPNGVRCPDCGWPVPPEHDAAIAARALRQAADMAQARADALDNDHSGYTAGWVDGVSGLAAMLRGLAGQVGE